MGGEDGLWGWVVRMGGEDGWRGWVVRMGGRDGLWGWIVGMDCGDGLWGCERQGVGLVEIVTSTWNGLVAQA